MSENKEKKKIYAIAAAATAGLAVIVLAVVLILGAGGQESYRSIRIVELDGGVTIDREGVGNLEASVNMNLTSGDRISTSVDSYVVLRLDDDKYMMLGEQGAIQVVAEGDAANSRTEIHLESGSVLSEIQNPLSQDSTYEIVTPNATMSVRGTVFETRNNVESGNIEVLVYEGTVAVALGDSEPVLYNLGEYTSFTSGDTPQFLEERGVITEEQMNSQMLDRLQQINKNGRTLDFGKADLEELIQQENLGQGSQVADNSQIQETEEPTVEPELPTPDVETPEPTVSTSPEPKTTKAPEPTATISPEPSPTVEPTPGVMPVPPEPSKPAPTVMPQGTVVFYLPPIAEAESLTQDGEVPIAKIGDKSPEAYLTQQVTIGSRIQEPSIQESKKPTGNSDNSLELEGWYTQSGEKWNFNSPLTSGTLNLYPVWKSENGDEYYYPVFLNAPEVGYYRCYCVKAGSYLFERPTISNDVTYQGYISNGAPMWDNHILMAWNQIGQGDALWGTYTQTVQGITSLGAVWLEKHDNGSLVLFTTGAQDANQDNYGDLIHFYWVENGGVIPAGLKFRSFSNGLGLPADVADKKVVDWKLNGDGESYKDYNVGDSGQMHIFHAVWENNDLQ